MANDVPDSTMKPEATIPPATVAPASIPTDSEPAATAVPAATGAHQTLTPEEQMALFEKELKETDWGHQPC